MGSFHFIYLYLTEHFKITFDYAKDYDIGILFVLYVNHHFPHTI